MDTEEVLEREEDGRVNWIGLMLMIILNLQEKEDVYILELSTKPSIIVVRVCVFFFLWS